MNDNLETWKKLGSEIKSVEKQLMNIMCNKEYQKLTNKGIVENLRKSVRYINKFKDKADFVAYKNLPMYDDQTINRIFYNNFESE